MGKLSARDISKVPQISLAVLKYLEAVFIPNQPSKTMLFPTQITLAGCGLMGRVGESVLGDKRLASISSAMANDVYSLRCLCEGVEPGCLKEKVTQKKNKKKNKGLCKSSSECSIAVNGSLPKKMPSIFTTRFLAVDPAHQPKTTMCMYFSEGKTLGLN